MPGKKRVRNSSGAKAAEGKVEEELSQPSVDELRKQLMNIGENPGPIDDSNK